jgi:hypothetical protein
MYHTWGNATWIIEGDISDCFGSLPHEKILSLLGEKIHDGRFLHLVEKLLNAGYLEEWKYHRPLSGVPQGSLVSPILSTLLLDKLDKFVEPVLIPQYTQGETRKLNPDYRTLQSQMRTLFAKGQKEAALNVRKRMQKLPSIHPRDPDWRRLKYIRYADDFGLAFTGPKSEAEAIKQAVATFLREELGLKLSEEKTLITHARSQAARFLGYAHYDDAKRTLATARAAIASNDEVSTAKSDDESHEPSLWKNANALSKQENPSIEPNCSRRVISPVSLPPNLSIEDSSTTLATPTLSIGSRASSRRWKRR